MSSIDKLLIRGIRSFDPKTHSVIEFYSPLTLIVGHNGSGKTTIIESLKYATTGELPPNTKQGAFVHDPKLSKEAEVKAQVKLKFRNTRGYEMVCTRSLQATQREKSIQQKTLESILEAKDPNTNERRSISTRCADLDAEIPSNLGISKAILDNVIFCHQEEANWPLSEPAVLKKKFDEIFASSRHTKALEQVRALKKEKEAELKAEVAWLKQKEDRATRAEQLAAQKEALRSQIEALAGEVADRAARLDAAEQQKEELVQKVAHIDQINRELIQHGETKRALQEALAELSATMDGSEDELRAALGTMEQQLAQHGSVLYQLEREKTELLQGIEEVRGRVQAALREQGRVEKEKEHYEEHLRLRRTLLASVTAMLKVDAEQVAEANCVVWIRAMSTQAQTAFGTMKREVDQQQAALRERLHEANTQLATVRTQATALETSITENKRKRDALAQLEETLASQGLEISVLQRKIDEESSHLQAQNAVLDERRQRAGLQLLQREAENVAGEIMSLNKMLAKVGEVSEKRFLLKAREANLREQEEKLASLKLQWNALTGGVMHNLSEFDVLAAIETEKDGSVVLESQVQVIAMELAEKGKEVDVLKSRITVEQEEIKSVQAEILKLEHSGVSLREVCILKENLESQERKVKELLSKLQEQKTFKSTLDGLEEQSRIDQACKLCHKSFMHPNDMHRLSESVKELVSSIPSQINEYEKQLHMNVEALRELRESQPNILLLEQYRAKLFRLESSAFKEQLDRALVSRDALNERQRQLFAQREELASKLRSLENMKNAQLVVNQLAAECTSLRSELSLDPNEISPEELQLKLKVLAQRDVAIRKHISLENTDIQTLMTEIASLQSILSSHQAQLLRFQVDQSKKDTIASELDELRKNLQTLETSLDAANTEREEVRLQVQALNAELEQMVQKDSEKLYRGQQRIIKLKSYEDECAQLHTKIEQLSEKRKLLSLDTIQQNLTDLNTQLASQEKEVRQIDEKVRTMQQSQSEWSLKEKEILSNLAYRQKQQRHQEVSAKIQAQLDELGALEANQYTARLQSLRAQQTELIKEHSKFLGEKEQLEVNFDRISKELDHDYASSQKDFRKQQIKVRTSELANKDLEKYARIMDVAIMKYHTMKMEEVNKTIRDLWVNIYQGNDIETIQIRSDKESNRGHRQYAYCLVMVQNGCEMEMRGRCSAGQKVLASIIIRMALAESFSLDCGILALDEPTTNLDRDNIEALAEALHAILHARQHQPNFQLIIITHDEDFVRLLGKSEFAEYFIRVFKGKHQCSMVERVPIEAI